MDLDIFPFAHIARRGDSLVLRWEEPRDIHRIVLWYEDHPPDRLKVDYWQKNWPRHRRRREDLESGRIGRSAWKPQDDWFNGSWVEAKTVPRHRQRCLSIRFAPLGSSELEDADNYRVRFRRTLKLRLTSNPRPSRIAVYTATKVRRIRVKVDLGIAPEEANTWRGEVKVYNGRLLEVIRPSEKDPSLRLRLEVSKPGPLSFDGTIVTVRSKTKGFSFAPADLEHGPIVCPDLGVGIKRTSPPSPATTAKRGCLVYEETARRPEQTLGWATSENPPKRPMHFIVGVEGCRQKFGVEPSGDVFAGMGYVKRVPGPETDRISWTGDRLYLRLGLQPLLPSGRFLLEGFLPVLIARFTDGRLEIEEAVFATTVSRLRRRPDPAEPVVAFICLKFRNLSDRRTEATGTITAEGGKPLAPEFLLLRGNTVRTTETGSLRFLLEAGEFEVSCARGGVAYRTSLSPGEEKRLVIKFPFIDRLTPDELERLREKSWAQGLDEVKEYWRRRAEEGTQIRTGEKEIDDFYRAVLTHILINDEREAGSDLIVPRVSSFNYGNYPNESVMQIMELDRRGLHPDARARLEVFLKYQGTKPLPGLFRSKRGLFYGSGGYESGGYNQHHGWVLWGLAEHFFLTGDEEWLRRVSDSIVHACDWVISERRSALDTVEGGRACGLLPPGSLEDVKEYWYWFSTDALTYRGLVWAARALEAIGHPEAQRLISEAEAFRADIAKALEQATLLSPLVRLRDGIYVPHVPSRPYRRGREVGWIREVLGGAISCIGTVLRPDSQISTWILKDYEDNRYLDYPYAYRLDDPESQWFSLGGFSLQPNLTYTISPYLLRDEVKHFLRSFFNAFAACWRADIRCMTEHPLPTLCDWAGDHFKSSDESMVLLNLRAMFIREEGEDLYLGQAIPRGWLKPGASIHIKNAATHFGPMTLEMEVARGAQSITAKVEPPTRSSPRRIFLRLRHPMGWELEEALLDGERLEESRIDRVREWIRLGPLTRPFEVRARYRREESTKR